MNWLTVIGTTAALLLAVLKMWAEHNDATKKKVKSGIQTVLDGIEEKDASKITAGFDAINNAKRGV